MFVSVLAVVVVSMARAKRGVFSALMDFASRRQRRCRLGQVDRRLGGLAALRGLGTAGLAIAVASAASAEMRVLGTGDS